ncbi:24729_t:CDS:2, partial [Gigaspora rosea]
QYDTSFKPNQHFYFSMGNLSIPVLRLVTCDTLEHVIVYGMIHKCSFINDSSVETFKNILFYGLKSISKQYRIVMGRDSSSFPYAHICTSILMCAKSNTWDRLERTIREFINLNINKWFENNKPTTGFTLESIWNYRENGEITASTLAECNINLSDNLAFLFFQVEVGSSCKKRSRSTRNELAPALSDASSEFKKLKELIKQKDDIIKQLQETNSKLVLENSQLRQQHLMFNQQSLNQSIINKSEKKNGNVINGDVIMSSSSPSIVSYQSHIAPTENFPDQFSCQLQNCNKRFDSEKKLLVHQRSGHLNNEVIILD